MKALRAYWWSPRRKAKVMVREGRRDPRAWTSLALITRRPFMNFGDELTPLTLSMASNRPVRWAPPHEAEFIAVGSIIDYYAISGGTGGATVWGSGLRSGDHTARELDAIKAKLGRILAVRGPLTRRQLGLPPDTVLGDPGVLAGRLVRAPSKRKRGQRVIPHFRTWSSPAGLAEISRLRALGFAVIPPADTAANVLSRISSLDFLYSSSLHGLIAAHALGIPAQWVDIPGASTALEPHFKFDDYLKSIGSPMEVLPFSRAGTRDLDDLLERRRAESTALAEQAERMAEDLLAVWR